MKLKIIKPDSTIYEGEARLVQLPGTGGLFEIMNNHAPIISALAAGNIRVVISDSDTRLFPIIGGVVKCRSNEILVLAQ